MTERGAGMEAREEQVTMEPLLSPGKTKAKVKAARFQVASVGSGDGEEAKEEVAVGQDENGWTHQNSQR